MDIGARIATLRRAAGLSQEQLGFQLGVSRQAVSKWESGQANPDIAYLPGICNILHTSADYLILGRDPTAAPPSMPPASESSGDTRPTAAHHSGNTAKILFGAVLALLGGAGLLALYLRFSSSSWEHWDLINDRIYTGFPAFLRGSGMRVTVLVSCFILLLSGLGLCIYYIFFQERRKK